MDEISMSAKTMPLGEVISQLGSLKENSADFAKNPDSDEIWQHDIDALEASIAILEILLEEGITDAEIAHDLLYDYHGIAKQYRAMHERYEVPKKAAHADGVWHCPRCHKRVGVNHTHCHWCGQKIKWG